jgi:hypothetical protein
MNNSVRKSTLTKLRRRKGNDGKLDKTRAVQTRSPNVDTQGLITQGVSLTQEPKLISLAGPGCHVLSTLDNMTAQLDGALAGMGERSLLLVCVVTAYNHSVQGTILLEVGCAGHNKRAKQTELLFNSQNLRKNGMIVDDTTKRDGGEHQERRW